jgi:tonB-linked outer membrane protein, susC/ragA family
MRITNFLYALLLLIAVPGYAQAQTKEVSGVVRDASGAELLGVAVIVQGTHRGTQTDLKGHYKIKVQKGEVLEFSSLGLKTQTFKVGNSSQIDVILVEDVQDLDEFVVVGYGSGRKISSVVGSVARVGEKDIAQRPSGNVVDALQGKVAGLQVSISSGEPSGLSKIRLDGVGSLGGATNSPLFVLDGITVSDTTVRALNQSDIESISVLKDASATSIYGSRAANGVVYITTKRGKNNTKGEISFSTQYGISDIADRRHFERMMNADELAAFLVDIGRYSQAKMDEIRRKNPYDTRWHKVYFRENIPMEQVDLSVSGGNEKTTYYVSGSYFNQEGLMYRSGFDRLTLRSNIDSRVNNWLKLGVYFNTAYYTIQTNPFAGANNPDGGLSYMLEPFYSPVDENGKRKDYIEGLDRYHPEYYAENNLSSISALDFIPSGFVEITPIKGLTFKTNVGVRYTNALTSSTRLPSYKGNPGDGTTSEKYDKVLIRTLTNTLEYKFDLAQKHNFVVLLGQESVKNESSNFSASGSGLINDDLTLLSNTTKNKNVGEGKNISTINSLFGRLEYDYEGKYFADFSLRRDGSSKFSPDYKYANFWATGIMWKLKKEKFLENNQKINDLSLKFSVGTSGNSDIGDYTHQASVGSGQYNSNTTYSLSNSGNPELTWEKQRKYTIGLTSAFFDNRLSVNADFYSRITESMLMSVPVAYTTGFTTIRKNIGKLQNRGVNITISADVYKNKEQDILVTPYVNFGYNKNKVLELFSGKTYWKNVNEMTAYMVGESVKYFTPIFKGVNPNNGEPQWYANDPAHPENTLKDDNKIVEGSFSADLAQNTGYDRYAPINGGFGFSASYKAVSLQVDFAYSIGKYTYNNDRYFNENPTKFGGYTYDKNVRDYWKRPGDVTQFPRKGRDFTQRDSRLIEDASFLRLKNITLSYSLPKDVVKEVGFFSKVRFYTTGRNLLTFTKFTGLDPEIDDALLSGDYPGTKQYVFGVELKF